MDISTLAWLFFIIAPASTIVHELGHAAGAMAVRADSIRIIIGTGKRKWVIGTGKFRILLFPVFFLGGHTFSDRYIPYSRKESFLITLSGPLSSTMASGLLLALFAQFGYSLLLLAFLFNAWMAIGNLLPYKVKGRQSDGYALIQLLRRREQ